MTEKGLDIWKFKATDNCEVCKTGYCRVRLLFLLLTYWASIPEISVLPAGSRAAMMVVFGRVLSAAQLPIDLKSWAGGNNITVLSFWGLVQLTSPYFPHVQCGKASK